MSMSTVASITVERRQRYLQEEQDRTATDKYERREGSKDAREKPPADALGVFDPLLAERLPERGILHARATNAYGEPPRVPHREDTPRPYHTVTRGEPDSKARPRRASGDALGHPSAGGEVGEAETSEDEEGAGIGGVADDVVGTGGDELVLGGGGRGRR
ncbi:hypothetical protein ONZ51_g13474 [Trametes cubensis]|uniref:Uncharacterized protein n=1 Tax=Trametes cubensis TaxID=1111947 RepID=A0AAD7X3W0_9APHY|nr:hypothetical protein ONZ51_g13474 [Trametes cubensis]